MWRWRQHGGVLRRPRSALPHWQRRQWAWRRSCCRARVTGCVRKRRRMAAFSRWAEPGWQRGRQHAGTESGWGGSAWQGARELELQSPVSGGHGTPQAKHPQASLGCAEHSRLLTELDRTAACPCRALQSPAGVSHARGLPKSSGMQGPLSLSCLQQVNPGDHRAAPELHKPGEFVCRPLCPSRPAQGCCTQPRLSVAHKAEHCRHP